MGREERKLKKALQQREITERRKLAQKAKRFDPKSNRNPQPFSSPTIDAVVVGPGLVATASGTIACRTQIEVVVGDRVRIAMEPPTIVELLKRRTLLSRPDPANQRVQRLLAANIDLVVNVVSVKTPPLRTGLIDRYLIAIAESGASPLICVNKTDLDSEDGAANELRPYGDLGIPVLFCSALTGAGMGDLRRVLAYKTSVLTGHSGVGKSSLLNSLVADREAAIGAVGAGSGKGRHTTTSSHLYALPGGGAIIDTPGIRQLGLWNVEPEEVRHYFHEFDPFTEACAFADCSHTHEPRCGVKHAVAGAKISPMRYAAYLRIISPSAGEGPP